MARIRTIKPEFFKHEDLFELEEQTGLPIRLSFAGLWCCCDREGRFKWRPRQLKTDILPYDEIDFSRVLDALLTRGFVVRYACGSEVYGVVPSFKTHQIINNREAESVLPGIDDADDVEASIYADCDACGTREPRVIHAAVGEGKGREGKGRGREEEGNGEGAIASPLPTASPSKPAKKASQLPADFQINETGIRYATERGVSIESEFASFRNWHAAKGTTLKDWQAGWRTWCDKAVEFGRAGNQKRPAYKTVSDQRAETFAALTGQTATGYGNAQQTPQQGGLLIEGEASHVA